MADNSNYIGVAMGLDVSDLKSGISEANKQIQLANSKFKAASSGMDDWTKSTDGLNAKIKQLDTVLIAQQAKLKGLTAEYEKVVAEQGEGSEAARKLQIQMNNQQAVVNSTERELNNYRETLQKAENGSLDLENATLRGGKAIQKAGKEAKEADNNVEELSDASKEAGGSLDKLSDASKEAGNNLDGLKGIAGAVGKGIAAIATAAIAAGTALGAAVVSSASYADEMLTMSTVTGVSTDNLQAFSYAAELVDVDLETMTKSMAKNIKSMSGAADGSKAYAEAYQKLGISVTDANGNLRDSETVYWETIDALGQMTNETERDALAMQLFGKSAQELNPLIEVGAKKMQELTEEARSVGAVMSEEALSSLGEFDDSLQRLKGSASAAKNSLGTVLLPEMLSLTNAGGSIISQFTSQLNESGGGLGGLAEAIKGVAPMVSELASSLVTGVVETVGEVAPALVSVATTILPKLVDAISSMLPTLLSTASSIIVQLVDAISSMLPTLLSTASSIIVQLVDTISSLLPTLLSTASGIIVQLADTISSMLPSLVSSIMTLLPILIEALLSAIPQLLQAATTLLLSIVQAVPLLVDSLVSILPTVIQSIIRTLIQSIPLLLKAAIQLLNAIVQAIPVILQALVQNLPLIIDSILSGVLDAYPLLLDAAITLLFSLIDAIPTIVSALFTALPQIIEAILTSLVKATPKLFATAQTLLNKLIDAVGELARKLPKSMGEIITAMVSGLTDGIVKIKDVGGDLIRGLWNGISDMSSWISKKIKGFGENVLGGIKDFFGINSPSKLIEDEVGVNIGKAFVPTRPNAIAKVKRELTKFSKYVSDNLGDVKNNLTLSGSGMPLASGVGTSKHTVVNAGMTVNYNGALSRKKLKQLENDNYIALITRLKAEGAI